MITRTKEGLIYADELNRANGALGAGWSVQTGAASIVSNAMQSTTNATNVKAVAPNRSIGVIFAKISAGGGGAGGLTFRHSDDGWSYYLQFEVSGIASLFARTPGYVFLGPSLSAAQTPGVLTQVKAHFKNDYQKVWIQDDGSKSISRTNAALNAKTGTGGLHHNNTGTIREDDFYYCEDNYLKMIGLPAGHKIRVTSSTGIIRTATEVGGVATITDLDKDLPYTKIEVLDATDVLVEDHFPAPSVVGGPAVVWPSDEYEYVVTIDPPSNFVVTPVGTDYPVGVTFDGMWDAAPAADNYRFAYSVDGGAKISISVDPSLTRSWTVPLTAVLGTYKLHVRAEDNLGGLSVWLDSQEIEIRQPLPPEIVRPEPGSIQDDPINIEWFASEGNSFDLEWRLTPTAAWTSIAADVGDVREYSWPRPTPKHSRLTQIRIRSRITTTAYLSDWLESGLFVLSVEGLNDLILSILTSNPIGCYPFDDVTGVSVVCRDVSGNARDGFYVGDHTREQPALMGGLGKCIDFNTGLADGRVEVPILNLEGKSCAFACIMSIPNVGGTSPIYVTRGDNVNPNLSNAIALVSRTNRNIGLHFNFDETVTSANGVFAYDTPIFVVCRYDKVTDKSSVWLDGVKLAEGSGGPMTGQQLLSNPRLGQSLTDTNTFRCKAQIDTVWVDAIPTDADIVSWNTLLQNPKPTLLTPINEEQIINNLINITWFGHGSNVEGAYSLDGGTTLIPLFSLQAAEFYDWDITAIPNVGVRILIRAQKAGVYTDYVSVDVLIWRSFDVIEEPTLLTGITAVMEHSVRVSVGLPANFVQIQIATNSDMTSIVVGPLNGSNPSRHVWVTGLVRNTAYWEQHRTDGVGDWSTPKRFRTKSFDPYKPHNVRNKILTGGPNGGHGLLPSIPHVDATQFIQTQSQPELAVPMLEESSTGDPKKLGVRLNMDNTQQVYNQTPQMKRMVVRFDSIGWFQNVPGHGTMTPWTALITFVPEQSLTTYTMPLMGIGVGVNLMLRPDGKVQLIIAAENALGGGQISGTIWPTSIVYELPNFVVWGKKNIIMISANAYLEMDNLGNDGCESPVVFLTSGSEHWYISATLNSSGRFVHAEPQKRPPWPYQTWAWRISNLETCLTPGKFVPYAYMRQYWGYPWLDVGFSGQNSYNASIGRFTVMDVAYWLKVMDFPGIFSDVPRLTATQVRNIVTDFGKSTFHDTILATNPWLFTDFSEYSNPVKPVLSARV